MAYYIVFLLIFCVLDIATLKIQKDKKGIIVYIIFAVIALILGIWFYTHEYDDRLYVLLSKLLNLKV